MAEIPDTPASSAGWIAVDFDGTLAHYDPARAMTEPGRALKPMVERVRHLFFLAEGSRVIRAANLPTSTECLSRPPELLDLATLGANTQSAVIVLHPDPPLPVFERTVLEEGAKKAKPVTPTTAFAPSSAAC